VAKERIEEIVERIGSPLAEELGYELVDVEYRKEGPDWILRCFIDCPSGTGLDECQRYSEELSRVLDEVDPIPGSYLLEVSSPGMERPLKKEADFQRFAGEKIEIKLHQALNGQKVFRGILMGLEPNEPDNYILLKINDEPTLKIPRKSVAKANLYPEVFGPEGGRKK
jgi:ribosome maturation factor RimP